MIARSKYRLFPVAAFIFFSIIFLGMGLLLFPASAGIPSGKKYLGKIFFFAMGLSMPYFFLKQCPRIIFDDEFLTVRSLLGAHSYVWGTIKDIYLSKKERFSMFNLLRQNMEATTVVFDGGEKIVLWENYYSNLAELRGVLAAKCLEKIRDPAPDKSSLNLQKIPARKYAGNPWININTGILAAIILIFGLASPSSMKTLHLWWIPGGIFIFFLAFFGTQMNYFVFNQGSLVIRNHYFWWKKTVIDLTQVQELVIETPYRRSTGLRILFRDFQSKWYGAGSLTRTNWKDILQDLQAIGIPFRDDTLL